MDYGPGSGEAPGMISLSLRRWALVTATLGALLAAAPPAGAELLGLDDGADTAERVLRDAVARGGVTGFTPQHPSLAQIFKEVIA